LFTYNITTGAFTKLIDLSHTTGSIPNCLIQLSSISQVQTISNQGNVFEVNAYPNPFSGSLQLKVSGPNNENLKFKIYDVWGRLLESKEDMPINDIIKLGNNLSNGIYLVNVKQGMNEKSVRVLKVE
jgi:hypothetical protein